ncbi:MAG: DUF2059 domain-containing protein [Acidobacteriota bacterium]
MRKSTLRSFVGLVAVTVVSVTLNAAPAEQVEPAKEKSIRTLLNITGMPKLAEQIMTQMLDGMASSAPGVSTEVWDRFKKKLNPDELVDLMIPVYDKYYTQSDVDGMVDFYKTPLGQKVIATLPGLSSDSMQIGRQWGEAKAHQVIEELEKEGKLPH